MAKFEVVAKVRQEWLVEADTTEEAKALVAGEVLEVPVGGETELFHSELLTEPEVGKVE